MSRVPDAPARIMEGASAVADGVAGYVPTPSAGNPADGLRRDGTFGPTTPTGGVGGGGTPDDGSVTNAKIASNAAIQFSKLEADPRARSGHTGTQPASTISDFAQAVRQLAPSGSSIRKTITQAAHGFTAKQAVYDNNGAWALAKADALSTSRGVWVVESVSDLNTFVAVRGGDLTVSGWSANTVYYLSAATAGLLDSTPPSNEGHFLLAVVRTGASAVGCVLTTEPLTLAKIPNNALASDAARPAQVSAPEVAAGTETELRSYSPADIVDFIDQHAAAGGPASFTTGMTMLWPRALSGSIPSGWMECDGNNGTDDQADIGALMVIMKHGGTVATPSISPAAGTYASTQSVTITTSTSGATIKYTTNGSTPSRTNGTAYSGAFSVSSTTTVKAIAYKDYSLDSAVASSAFTIDSAPTLVSWTIESNGTTHTLVFSAAVSAGAGGSGGLVAHMSGGDVTLTVSSGTGTTTLTCTGSRTVLGSETETGSKGQYTQPGNGLESGSGTDVASFSNQTITNSSTQSGGTPTWYANFSPAGGSEVGLYSEFAQGGTISSVPAGTIDRIEVYIININAGGVVLKLALLNSSAVPQTSGETPGISIVGWHGCDISYSHAGGDLGVAAIMKSGAFGGAIGSEKGPSGVGAFGGNSYSGSWPDGSFSFTAPNNLLVRVRVTS